MKWLTVEYIKQHSRIDDCCEDVNLELYGEAAEKTVLNVIGMTFEELTGKYGCVPAPLIHASLLLVDVSYNNRSPVSTTNMSVVPYTFDLLVKPYMKL